MALTAADRYAYSLLPAALQGTSLSSPGPSSSFPNPKDVTHQGQHAARSLHERGQARGIANHQPSHASLESSTLLQQSSTHFGQPATQARSHEQPYYAPDAGLIQQRSAAVASSWDSGLRDILSSLEPSDRAVKPVSLAAHISSVLTAGITPTGFGPKGSYPGSGLTCPLPLPSPDYGNMQ